MPKINVVRCPCCDGELYRSVKNETNSLLKGSAKLERDEAGYFMKCPHCRNRIVMESDIGSNEFRLSDIQPCNQKFP